MAKFLHLIRHAKSSWKDMTLDDFNRPLNNRGKNDAPLMGKILNKNNEICDLIISSDAKRAKSTAKLIKNEIKYNNDIVFNHKLYDASIRDIYEVLSGIPDDVDNVFLIAHNPCLNMLAYELVDFNMNISTCGIVKIKLSCKSWKYINKDNSTLVSFDYPKKYKD